MIIDGLAKAAEVVGDAVEKAAEAAEKISEAAEKTGEQIEKNEQLLEEVLRPDIETARFQSLESIMICDDSIPGESGGPSGGLEELPDLSGISEGPKKTEMPWYPEVPNTPIEIGEKIPGPGEEVNIPEASEKVGLTEEEKVKIKEETGWSDEIIDHIESMEQYEVYKEAGLHEGEVNGRKCLLKDIDPDYVDPKTGMTNRERMERGLSPIEAKTGEKIELHHIGQDFDSPFAELCENSEHGDGKHSILHTSTEGSWRNDPEMDRDYKNQKRHHWQTRAQEG